MKHSLAHSFPTYPHSAYASLFFVRSPLCSVPEIPANTGKSAT